METARVIGLVREAFAETEHPGDGFLLGSREGEDSFAAVAPFRGHADWRSVDPALLDEHYDALSFLSEGGFRFFLPAWLIADLEGRLQSADPVFHLTGGFSDASVEVPAGSRVFERHFGRSVLLNPRRYGAMTFEDYARFRLSVFTREESAAIAAYLEHRRDLPGAVDAGDIEAALDAFWRARAESAPGRNALATHLRAEEEFLRAMEDEPGD